MAEPFCMVLPFQTTTQNWEIHISKTEPCVLWVYPGMWGHLDSGDLNVDTDCIWCYQVKPISIYDPHFIYDSACCDSGTAQSKHSTCLHKLSNSSEKPKAAKNITGKHYITYTVKGRWESHNKEVAGKQAHLEQGLFSPHRSKGFSPPWQNRAIKAAALHRDRMEGTCDAVRAPPEITRLGSFSSFVTSGSDSARAVKEQSDKNTPSGLQTREQLGAPQSCFLAQPSRIWPPSLSPLLAGLPANRFLDRMEVGTISFLNTCRKAGLRIKADVRFRCLPIIGPGRIQKENIGTKMYASPSPFQQPCLCPCVTTSECFEKHSQAWNAAELGVGCLGTLLKISWLLTRCCVPSWDPASRPSWQIPKSPWTLTA